MRNGGGAGENMFCLSVLTRRKFSDLMAPLLLRTGFAPPAADLGGTRAMVAAVVESCRIEEGGGGGSLPSRFRSEAKSPAIIHDVYPARKVLFPRINLRAFGRALSSAQTGDRGRSSPKLLWLIYEDRGPCNEAETTRILGTRPQTHSRGNTLTGAMVGIRWISRLALVIVIISC